MSTSEPPIEIVELPLIATLGTLVRSPESVLTGRPSILPLTAISRWALLRFLVDSDRLLDQAGRLGSGSDGFFEQPETSPEVSRAAASSAASMTKRRRNVGIAAS